MEVVRRRTEGRKADVYHNSYLSYEQEQELEAVKVLLAPMLRNVKVQPSKGKYKRAYMILENTRLQRKRRIQ